MTSDYKFKTANFKFKNPNAEIKLSINDPITTDIHRWYENACTAEYLIEHDTYGEIIKNKENVAYNIAVQVREKMRDYNISEEEAIENIFRDIDISKFDFPAYFDKN